MLLWIIFGILVTFTLNGTERFEFLSLFIVFLFLQKHLSNLHNKIAVLEKKIEALNSSDSAG